MGVYLSKANTHLEAEGGRNDSMAFCVGEIQGWRRNMEDAHIADLDLSSMMRTENRKINENEKMSIFGVFDGHGGKEVAKFVQIKFIRELVRSKAFNEQRYKDALRETFHRIDDMLEDPKYDKVLNKLKALPNPSDMQQQQQAQQDSDGDGDDGAAIAVSKMSLKTFDPTNPEYESDDNSDGGDVASSEGKGKSSSDTIASLVDKPIGGKKKGSAKKKLTKSEAIELFTQLILKETRGKAGLAGSLDDSNLLAGAGANNDDNDNDNDEEDMQEEMNGPERIDKQTWARYYKNPSHIPGDSPRPSLQNAPASISTPSGVQCNLRDHRVQAGCTSVVVLRIGNTLYCANAGDSRSVLCRGDGKVHALSEDHKPDQPVEMARIDKAGGFINVNGRINGNLNLSRSLGDMKYKQVNSLMPSEQMITAEPDFTVTEVLPTDKFFILACDGVWDVLDNQEICDFVSERLYPTPDKPMQFKTNSALTSNGKTPMSTKDIVADIFEYCVADDPKKTQGIGGDNMTCMIVELL